jgi:nicotinate-nucleotide adenylyltransferase
MASFRGSKVRLGVMGGTFNPIHYGHLAAANEVREAFALDQILFIPAASPPHKDQADVIASRHRWVMTVLATISRPDFVVSAIEIDRPGASYSVETIAQLKQEYEGRATIYFILGIDAFVDIASWWQPDVLLQSCHTIVTHRPGFRLREAVIGPLQRLMEMHPRVRIEPIEERSGSLPSIYSVGGTPYQVFLQDIAALDISSTHIRQRIKNGQSIGFLLPESVEAYIQKYQLYR